MGNNNPAVPSSLWLLYNGKGTMHGKVLRKTEIHLTCVKKDPTVSRMLFLQSSHIYCSPKLLWKRQTVPNSNGVLLRASPAPFQFKAIQFKCFIPPPTLPPSPTLSTKFDCFPNTWNEHFEQKHIILSDGDDHNLKEKWPILHGFCERHWGGMSCDPRMTW